MLWIWWVLETRFIVSFTHRSTHAYAHTLSHFLLFWPVKLILSPLSHMLQCTVWVQNWPVCSPDLWPIKTIWNIMKGKTWQSEPWSVEQLKSSDGTGKHLALKSTDIGLSRVNANKCYTWPCLNFSEHIVGKND